ncbi:hypothetical protein K491DRAFT_719625 [Lophiostoma macrostomum CBS 122681]|uniref:Arrestin-like N-terminal domain-containing protein n=1 Tax=Lophiostoma macrostomum CBS 122681 TaxID=1314788 RepID=A0A6A6SYT6_9PLEO|nr:hypothetical protein K491DRAFT_719625 [Lophiostoma macrostomum CBS 122681]
MAVNRNDQQLLSTFPRPPPGPPTPSPRRSTFSSPQPTAVHRPADFGFIHVALDDEDADHSFAHERASRDEVAPSLSAPTLHRNPTAHNHSLEELQLVLDSPHKLYSPGEAVTGYISGWDAAFHVHVIFEGYAEACIDTENIHSHNNAQYKNHVLLLYQITHLRPESQKVVPRFTTTIPEKVGDERDKLKHLLRDSSVSDNYWPYDWPHHDTFEHNFGHPLPPSVLAFNDTYTDFTTRTQGQASVKYKLIAVRSRLDITTGKLISDASYETPLYVTTRRPEPQKSLELISTTTTSTSNLEIRTSQLARERRVSFYDHIRDSFSSTTPSFHFTSSISAPKVSIPGGELRIGISVAILPPPPGRLYNFPVPDILIQSFLFRVRSYTGLRIPRLFPNPPISHTFRKIEVEQRKASVNVTFTPKKGNFDEQVCWITVKLPEDILSSFKTYNLWRGYRVECEVDFVVAGKDGVMRAQSDLNIVAGAGHDASQ